MVAIPDLGRARQLAKERLISTAGQLPVYFDVALDRFRNDKVMFVYFCILSGVIMLGVIGPELVPYSYNEYLYAGDGSILRTVPPSLEHPLGTNDQGQDVLSRMMYGARPTVITGLLGGTIIVGIGGVVGITAGYKGGLIDDILMRITDFFFGVPLIPFAIVLLAFLDLGFFAGTVVIGMILWRSSARILRSQVIQIKERPYIMAAKTTGASDIRIIMRHIIPNIAPMAVLLFSLGIGYAIIAQAGLAFIGVTNPFVPSWGVMIRNAYNSGLVSQALWWSIPPGIMISLTVLSAFMFGRKLVNEGEEEVAMG